VDIEKNALGGKIKSHGHGKDRNPKKAKKAKWALKTFTIRQRLNILAEIRRGVHTQKEILLRVGASKSAMHRWKQEEPNLIKQLEEEHCGGWKKMFVNDGLKQVEDGWDKFYELNETMPKTLHIPLTRKY
jgi:hypothetical protein